MYLGNTLSSVSVSGGSPQKLSDLPPADENPVDFGPIAMTNDEEAAYVLQGDYWSLGTAALAGC
jgi:hypothetical protein